MNDPEFEQIVVDEYYKINNKFKLMFTWSIWRTRLYYACLIVIGGLSALQGSKLGDFSTVIGLLTFIETELSVQ
jgi:hypothetical protein